MTAIFSDFLGDSLEVFMDNFSVFGNDFENSLAHLTKILEVCVRKRLVLKWEKFHFMVYEGVVLRHIVSGKGLEVDKAKIEVIQNLSLPGTSAFTRDSYKFLIKSPSHSSPFFAKTKTKTSSSMKKGSVHL